jgi:hypothetical protein
MGKVLLVARKDLSNIFKIRHFFGLFSKYIATFGDFIPK